MYSVYFNSSSSSAVYYDLCAAAANARKEVFAAMRKEFQSEPHVSDFCSSRCLHVHSPEKFSKGSCSEFGKTLYVAAKQGSLFFLHSAIAAFPPSSEVLSSAVFGALQASEKRSDLLEAIFDCSVFPSFSKENPSRALAVAIHTFRIPKLIESNPFLLESSTSSYVHSPIQELLPSAAAVGNVEAVRTLLAFPRIPANIEKTLQEAAAEAAKQGRVDVLEEILSHPLSKGALFKTAMGFSVLFGHASMVKMLLDAPRSQRGEYRFNLIFDRAAKEGRLEVIQLLLNHARSRRFLSGEERGSALVEAAKAGQVEVVNEFLSPLHCADIPFKFICLALEGSAAAGKKEVVEAILFNALLPEEIPLETAREALKKVGKLF